MVTVDQVFLGVTTYTILQRITELMLAKRNTANLLQQGAVEFGASHYPWMVVMHAAFFISLIMEFVLGPVSHISAPMLVVFAIAQAVRFWVLHTLGRRWTTRVLVIRGERLVAAGPYRYLSHPNYAVVALEILALPLAFGLWYTAITFTILNALMLLFVRIPIERKALAWSQQEDLGIS